MENLEVTEEVVGMSNGNVIKVAAIVLGIGAIIGIGYGIKKYIDNKKVIKLGPSSTENCSENKTQE